MQSYLRSGESLKLTNTSGVAIASGAVVIEGNILGVASAAIAIAAEGIVVVEGEFLLDKTTSLVIAQGDVLYFNTTTKKITKTITDVYIGVATAAAASNDTTVKVLLKDSAGLPLIAAANVAQVATANGSDAATTQALANQLKTTLNALLTALKAKGIVVPD